MSLEPLLSDEENHVELVVEITQYAQQIFNKATEVSCCDSLKRAHFFYDMFPCYTDEREIVWWLPTYHLISQMLLEQRKECLYEIRGIMGHITVWSDDTIQDTIDDLIDSCVNQGLSVENNDK